GRSGLRALRSNASRRAIDANRLRIRKAGPPSPPITRDVPMRTRGRNPKGNSGPERQDRPRRPLARHALRTRLAREDWLRLATSKARLLRRALDFACAREHHWWSQQADLRPQDAGFAPAAPRLRAHKTGRVSRSPVLSVWTGAQRRTFVP